MRKVLRVAAREFASTALTKGFIFGAFIVPLLMMGLVFVLLPILMTEKAPKVSGTIAIVDPTGAVLPAVQEAMKPEAMLRRQESREARLKEAMGQAAPKGLASDGQIDMAAKAAATIPKTELTLEVLDPASDIEAEKEPLKRGTAQDGGRLALIAISPNAVERPDPSLPYGSFDLFVKPKLDDRISGDLRSVVGEAIFDARITAAGQDPAYIRSLTQVARPDAVTVSKDGEKKSSEWQIFLPFGFMALIMISVMVGGQYLLTTTIEEKSNRIVEVILSAVSPMELMTGKILGQMGVGLALLLMYGAVGWGSLIVFTLTAGITLLNAVLLVVYFILAYFLIASMMAAIGAAVNDLREAQSLMTPVMLVTMLPYLLWLPISRDPNGAFATVLGLLPPISPFVMVLRINSTEPPPMWQIPASILINVIGVYIMLRLTAKIFRVGLLMYGKPPNLSTLIKWVKMA
ncbi:MAG: ABC transporter permease [Phycisphaeraceae bacterium]|nr:ABC transporter permease [Phycisphaeraceae bacterium]